jgi:non-ribosomal peptide synthetase component F
VIQYADYAIWQREWLQGEALDKQVSYWRQQLLHRFNDIAAQTLPQDLCARRLFEEQGARTPEAVSLVHEGEQLSYAELNGRANQLAHYLRRSGVEVETVVGLCLPRASIRWWRGWQCSRAALLICPCTGRGVVRTIILLQVKRRRTIE